MKEYHELAQRTAVTVNPDMVSRMRQQDVLADLAYILARFRDLGEQLSKLKAYVFYGKGVYAGDRPETAVTDAAKHQVRYDWQVKLLHGLLGLISESGELSEGVFDWLYREKDLDVANLIEELGDNAWFTEEAMEGLNVGGYVISREDVQKANILKLQARYGHKFTQDRAIIRDIEKERFAMTGAFTRDAMKDLPDSHREAASKELAAEVKRTIVDGSETPNPS